MTEVERYLLELKRKAEAAGLNARTPGQNWLPLAPITPGCHVSASVRRDQVQVSLNLERDEDRADFERLYRDRQTIERAVGEGLTWENKEGRRKTAIRATLHFGYADNDWNAQHEWAVTKLKSFQQVFGARLSRA